MADENGKVFGMVAAMNVWAMGPNEFRGTTDLDKGIYNVGLYAGLEVTPNPEEYTNGVAYTLKSGAKLQAGFKAFVSRELGNPPEGYTLDDLFSTDAVEKFAKLDDKPENAFKLYQFQVVEVETESGKKPAVVVSTNEKTIASAIGISAKQAALNILDGCGKKRPSANGQTTLGGAALEYFLNTMESYKKMGVKQPRMNAIAAEVVKLGGAIKIANAVMQANYLTDGEKETYLYTKIGKEYENVIYPKFNKSDSIANRDEVTAEWIEKSNLPRTAMQKIDRIAKLIESPEIQAKMGAAL